MRALVAFATVMYVLGSAVAAAETEQDSDEEIRDCVSAIVRYAKGQRPESPTFGITPPEFGVGVDIDRLRDEVADQEPRVQILTGTEIDGVDEGVHNVIVALVNQVHMFSEEGGSDA